MCENKLEDKLMVSVSLGATIPLRSNYENIRPEVRIQNIDVNGDVKGQIAQALAVASQCYAAVDESILEFIDSGAEALGGGLKIENRVDRIAEVVKELNRRLEVIEKKG